MKKSFSRSIIESKFASIIDPIKNHFTDQGPAEPKTNERRNIHVTMVTTDKISFENKKNGQVPLADLGIVRHWLFIQSKIRQRYQNDNSLQINRWAFNITIINPLSLKYRQIFYTPIIFSMRFIIPTSENILDIVKNVYDIGIS